VLKKTQHYKHIRFSFHVPKIICPSCKMSFLAWHQLQTIGTVESHLGYKRLSSAAVQDFRFRAESGP
jgi:hypothetical protein